MKKNIAVGIGIGIMLLLMSSMALASPLQYGSRVTYQDAFDSDVKGHLVAVYVSGSSSDNNVVVCTDKDKSNGWVSINIGRDSQLGAAMDAAKLLIASMKPAGGYDHFGCNTVRI